MAQTICRSRTITPSTFNTIIKAADYLSWRKVPETALAEYKKHAEEIVNAWTKEGEASPTLSKLVEWLNLTKGTFPGGIPNSPSPLASMLVTGLAGAGIGYGLGNLGERFLPNKWQVGNLPITAALAGGTLGVMPGAAWGVSNRSAGRDFNDNTVFQQRISDLDKASEEIKESFEKIAGRFNFSTGAAFSPIPVNEFNQVVWGDPRVAGPLDPPTQAAATGLITGAANLPGKRDTRFVTPMDVGRMAAGMGSGYLSGMLVGKALGTMMGMPQSTQDKLKNTGVWAGMVANLVPLAFGR